MERRNAAGIDAGASLWKLFRAYRKVEMEVVPAGSLERVQRTVERWAPDAVGITGVKSSVVAAGLRSIQCFYPNEFLAWALGAPVVAELQSLRLPRQYLLVSIGTGTSILEVKGGAARRLSGSTLGGGTLLGLSRLLGCGDSFSEFVELAARGDRTRVDLYVDGVFSSTDHTLLSGETASSFGDVRSKEPADLAHGLMWLIGENIGILCNAIARQVAVQTIVFGGTTLAGNHILRSVLCKTVSDSGVEALVLQDGAFCGAAGAALFARDCHQ